LRFNKRFIERFSGLFGDGDEETNEFSQRSQFAKRWGWYSSFYQLAKGDVTKFDEVSRIPATRALTLLTFEKQKAEIEQAELNKMKQ